MAIKNVDKAWAAGFFDGEGCVIIQRRKEPKTKHKILHLLHIEVAQVDILPLKKLKNMFGGRLYYDKYTKINKWIITNSNAKMFLEKIENFCTTKKKECQTALKFSKLIKPIGAQKALTNSQFSKREFYYKELQRLRKVKYGNRS